MGRRILVVEDDPAISHMITKVLAIGGYFADVVSEGRDALEAAIGAPYDAILLDVMLPGVDGLEVMRRIRSHPVTQAVPVIMLTARTDDETTWEAWKAGCDYFVTKPFDPATLFEILERFAGSGTPSETSPSAS